MSHKHQFTSRTKARKRAADVVYEADQRGMGRNAAVLRDLLREGVADELYRIDRLIDTHARTGLDRIPAVDRAVLRVAIWEMLSNSEEVPPVIAIDEAISIVKSISTEESAGFVNAILDAIRQDIESPSWSRRSSEADSGQESDEELSADELTELDDLLNEY